MVVRMMTCGFCGVVPLDFEFMLDASYKKILKVRRDR